MTLKATELVGNTDALVWSKQFCENFHGLTIADEPDDLTTADEINTGDMIVWFANAIMAGFDEGCRRQSSEVVSASEAEHLYQDIDIAHLAQDVENLRDVLTDILAHSPVCDYNIEEWCVEHRVGRPCPFEIARSQINAG